MTTIASLLLTTAPGALATPGVSMGDSPAGSGGRTKRAAVDGAFLDLVVPAPDTAPGALAPMAARQELAAAGTALPDAAADPAGAAALAWLADATGIEVPPAPPAITLPDPVDVDAHAPVTALASRNAAPELVRTLPIGRGEWPARSIPLDESASEGKEDEESLALVAGAAASPVSSADPLVAPSPAASAPSPLPTAPRAATPQEKLPDVAAATAPQRSHAGKPGVAVASPLSATAGEKAAPSAKAEQTDIAPPPDVTGASAVVPPTASTTPTPPTSREEQQAPAAIGRVEGASPSPATRPARSRASAPEARPEPAVTVPTPSSDASAAAVGVTLPAPDALPTPSRGRSSPALDSETVDAAVPTPPVRGARAETAAARDRLTAGVAGAVPSVPTPPASSAAVAALPAADTIVVPVAATSTLAAAAQPVVAARAADAPIASTPPRAGSAIPDSAVLPVSKAPDHRAAAQPVRARAIAGGVSAVDAAPQNATVRLTDRIAPAPTIASTAAVQATAAPTTLAAPTNAAPVSPVIAASAPARVDLPLATAAPAPLDVPVTTAAPVATATPEMAAAVDTIARDPGGAVAAPARDATTARSAPTAAAPALPAAPAIASAARTFADAIHRAITAEDRATAESPAGPTLAQPAAGAITAAAVAAPQAASQSPLDMTHQRWPEAMIQRIEMLRDMADAHDMRIRVVPDALGAIDVSLKRDGDTVQVQLVAEQAQTRALLAEAQPRLQEMAEQRGIKLQQTGGNTATGTNAGGSSSSPSQPGASSAGQSPSTPSHGSTAGQQPDRQQSQPQAQQQRAAPPRAPVSARRVDDAASTDDRIA